MLQGQSGYLSLRAAGSAKSFTWNGSTWIGSAGLSGMPTLPLTRSVRLVIFAKRLGIFRIIFAAFGIWFDELLAMILAS